MGVQTVMYMAAQFGEKELALPSGLLIGAILIIQLVAIGGAYLFALISKAKGNIFSLSVMLVIWIAVCVTVLFIYKSDHIVFLGLKKHEAAFLGVAFVVGMIMGGIQSLSRSTYAKLLPDTEDTTSFFSFYDVAEKMSTVGGTFMFGLAEAMTGSMRNSVIPLMVVFVIGLAIIQFARTPKLKAA
jgi:UMF1 family MFS transporter